MAEQKASTAKIEKLTCSHSQSTHMASSAANNKKILNSNLSYCAATCEYGKRDDKKAEKNKSLAAEPFVFPIAMLLMHSMKLRAISISCKRKQTTAPANALRKRLIPLALIRRAINESILRAGHHPENKSPFRFFN